MFKSVVSTPVFDKSLTVFDSLLTSIYRNVESSKNSELIKKIKLAYTDNKNKDEYDKFVGILIDTILSHAPKSMDGGKRRYTRKKRHNKRKTRKKRKQRVKQRITHRHKS
jgi:hypothetical protein